MDAAKIKMRLKRIRENKENQTQSGKTILKRGSFFGLMALLLVLYPSILTAQTTYDEVNLTGGGQVPSATSILTNHQSSGRFGTYSSGGYLSPSDQDGRFTSGAVRTPNGAYVGMDNNLSTSRFGSYWDKNSAQAPNADSESEEAAQRAYRFYSRAYRNQMRANEAAQTAENPQALTAEPTDSFPDLRALAQEREALLAAQNYNNNVSSENSFAEESENQTPSAANIPSEEIWMRGSARRRAAISQDYYFGNNSYGQNENDQTTPNNPQENQGQENQGTNGGSSFVGGQLTNNWADGNGNASAVNHDFLERQRQRQAQNQTAQLQESLEAQILQSPVVSPVSPIQVTFNNGTATIRGIVPTEESRIEAGQILLTNPNVETVNNQLTVLNQGSNKPLPRPFDPKMKNNSQSQTEDE